MARWIRSSNDLIAGAHDRLEGADKVADDIFGRIVKEGGEAEFRIQVRLQGRGYVFRQDAVLRDRKRMRSLCLPVPARKSRQTVRDVADLDIEGRWVERFQAAAR